MKLRFFASFSFLLVCSCQPAGERISCRTSTSVEQAEAQAAPSEREGERSDVVPAVGEMDAVIMPSKVDAESRPKASRQVTPQRVAYKSGITLDYETVQVEIASKVILRQGELELFAWSRAPVPKEHETILLVDAKPSDIFEALGLIGLTPGTPPHFDLETRTAHAATGDRVDVLVRYTKGGRDVEHSICDWAIDKSREAPLAHRFWRFCGSHRTEKGAFAADIEGTLVTVVDFPTSLLALAESHSESNADLWLVANTDAIPEVGTPVTLILRPVDEAAASD